VTEAGKLPPGVRFTVGPKGTAAIAGTPAASAKGKGYAVTLTARDGDGKAATQRFALKVS
jgi:Putative Ig domain